MVTSFFIGLALLIVLLLSSLPILYVFGSVVAYMSSTTTVGMKSSHVMGASSDVQFCPSGESIVHRC